jgi:hypothetical protein
VLLYITGVTLYATGLHAEGHWLGDISAKTRTKRAQNKSRLLQETAKSLILLVAGAGFEPATFRL